MTTAPSVTPDQAARPLFAGFAILTSGRAVVLALQLITFAVMAAALHPVRLGEYVFAVAFAGMFTLVTDFGFQPIVAREVAQRPDREATLLPNLAYLRLLLAAAGYLLVFVVLTAIGFHDGLRTANLIAATNLFVASLDSFQISWQVRLRMGVISAAALLQALVMLAGTIAASQAGAGVATYLALNVVSSLLNGVVVLVAATRIASFSWRPDPRLWPFILRGGAALGLADAVIALYYRLDLILLGRIKSPAAVGQYGAGYRFLDALNVLPSLVVTVLEPVMARSALDRRQAFQRRYARAMHLVWLLALPIGVIGAVTAAKILPRVPGFGQYHGAGRVLAILAPAGSCILVSTVLASVLVSAGLQRRLLHVSLMILVVNVLLNVALIPPFSATGAAVATTASEALVVVLSAGMIRRHLGLRWPARDLARTLPAGAAMTAVLLAASTVDPFAQAAIGLLAYLVCLRPTGALRPPDLAGVFRARDGVVIVVSRPASAARGAGQGPGRWVHLGRPLTTATAAALAPEPMLRRRPVALWRALRQCSCCVAVDLAWGDRALLALLCLLAWRRFEPTRSTAHQAAHQDDPVAELVHASADRPGSRP